MKGRRKQERQKQKRKAVRKEFTNSNVSAQDEINSGMQPAGTPKKFDTKRERS